MRNNLFYQVLSKTKDIFTQYWYNIDNNLCVEVFYEIQEL